MRRSLLRIGLAGLGALCVLTPAFGAEEGLEPFQLVRSLELVQDRIASGDHAALPMQRKLLEMVDARFRRSEAADFEEAKNLTALLVYAMSGGNPVTVEVSLSRLPADHTDRSLGAGILFYLQGQPKAAQLALAPIDPLTLTPELGAYVALVKGSILSLENPDIGLQLLDHARLLGPGTLVEEAALRRSIALSAELNDPERFILAAAQYVRRFIRSPYASQFADAFVEGVITLHGSLDLADLGGIASLMGPERERVIYLRIARRAAIGGLTKLSAFAAAKAADGDDDDATPPQDPRALLYSSLASITTGPVEETAARLAAIDRDLLSASDRRLLDAARAIAAEMTAKPRLAPVEEPAASIAAAEVVETPAEPAPPTRIRQVLPGHEGASFAAPVPPSAASPAVPAKATPPTPNETEMLIAEVRDKLAEIDDLLKDTAK